MNQRKSFEALSVKIFIAVVNTFRVKLIRELIDREILASSINFP